jgi:chemotaxis protein methyltransferase CheR
MQDTSEASARFEIALSEDEFQQFRSLVHKQTGLSLKETKVALVRSRLLKRLRHYGYENFTQYYDHLRDRDVSGEELQEMINAVTTHKTSFFREAHHFDCLVERLLEPACQANANGPPLALRIWSAGCSSGEEAYSIAITIAMNVERMAACDVKILASDIDTEVLRQARIGIYSRDSVSEIRPEVLRRCFLSGVGQNSGSVQLKPELRDLVRFAHLNLIDEPWPFRGKFDAIFCRNVIIYFDQDTQQRVIEKMAEHLKPGGLFFAGHSENLFWMNQLLEPIGHTVYRRKLMSAVTQSATTRISSD